MSNKIYIAWDDDPELFHLTFLHLTPFYKNSRIATLKEVVDHAVECKSFIKLMEYKIYNSDKLVEVVEGTFKILRESPVDFEEKYIYLVDFEGNKHLIY